MNNRTNRAPVRAQTGQTRPGQPHLPPSTPSMGYQAAPNAALLIDFDNVTMGIRSELAQELKSLLSSDAIKGKVAIRRAYADWRRYPQYVLPLTETSIDLIYAPAYGSARKNATDIRLAIDAMELVFTRPEIGTIVLLSGDSDFSSLVIKLKEYGKYVIGVGIRESSSDLLVQNCDEYFSYNALAGLVKSGDEPVTKWDPWELASEAVTRMKRNGDVMRADRLKQVMQEIDSTFDEKDLGMAKFSRFVQEAAQRGILQANKLENGQLEVDIPGSGSGEVEGAVPLSVAGAEVAEAPARAASEKEGGRSRRGRRDRGRDRRDREERVEGGVAAKSAAAATSAPAPATAHRSPTGERLTRNEAFELVKRAVDALTGGTGMPIPASRVREKASELLGRDSETLSERYFDRILQDAHDAEIIDLKRRGDDFEVTPARPAPTVAEQLQKSAPAPVPQPTTASPQAAGAAGRSGARAGRAGFGKRLGEAPAHLLSIGVVDTTPGEAPSEPESATAVEVVAPPAAAETEKPTRRTRGRKTAAAAEGSAEAVTAATRKPGKSGRKSAAKKKTESADAPVAEKTSKAPAKKRKRAVKA